MQDPLIVRDASGDELPDVSAVLTAAYAEHRARFPAPVWTSYQREVVAVAARLDAGELIVAVRGGEVVGTATFYAHGSLDGHAWPPGVASLRLLAVRPGARTAGVGRALVGECVQRARRAGAAELGLHTAPFMEAANRLYTDVGFLRAPAFDFDAEVHYAGAPAAGSSGLLAGEAFLLPLTGPAR